MYTCLEASRQQLYQFFHTNTPHWTSFPLQFELSTQLYLNFQLLNINFSTRNTKYLKLNNKLNCLGLIQTRQTIVRNEVLFQGMKNQGLIQTRKLMLEQSFILGWVGKCRVSRVSRVNYETVKSFCSELLWTPTRSWVRL